MAIDVKRAFLARGFAVAVAAVVAVGGLAGPLAPSPAFARGPESVADLADGLIDAVVNISTSQNVAEQRQVPVPQMPEGSPFQDYFDEFFGDKNGGGEGRGGGEPRKVQSLGSGFVIDSSGIIITNNHVIEDADEIVANFNDGSKLKAEIVGRDLKTDLAVLRVKPDKPLKAVKFGDSMHLRVGDWVMAIGNPFGLGGTVTVGIVSARNRDINSGPYDNFIQTDAAINRGNSGGPLFNMDGDVVGINTAIISPSGGSIGIGFAIPSEIAAGVVDQLRNFGETRRGWLGVNIQQVTDDLAESLGLDRAKGALVAGVTEGGPAAAAKIEPGDVIVSFDGKPIHEMRELPRLVANTPVGKAVDVTVVRKGKEEKLSVTLGRLEEGEKLAAAAGDQGAAEPAPVKVPEKVLGLTLGALDDDAKAKFKIGADVKGVVVTDVESGSPAADKRIQAGDTIVEVAQEPVSKPEDVAAAVKKLKDQDRKSALLLLANPAGELRFVAVKID
ncbi:DegQ family serine endoprotease [Oharaeibacter diazotrophicus]|uniref:Probable periplasmic serine endoprotease DegP-like n=2 Tax=Oharaeibacter diazotrophicus TaxID=1920512 RepID=A0A4R6RGW3_9HYPH|nr:DegQ family serine endoprotease [Oharaeibacter diazotrophicus]TDP85570.1 serine protease Do [Oharaeibacter diazotrophicus]BBE74541.1 putative periplasmic serine endoprotease DegP-like precursor [Pleomorphomonas sp. SM30]